MNFLKKLLQRTWLWQIYLKRENEKWIDIKYRHWVQKGRPVPPPHVVKQKILRDLARQKRLSVFVETGTFQGDMVESVRDFFNVLYSIELSPELYARAKQRFSYYKHIQIFEGDSGVVLKEVLARVQHPALFWLDGHYSEGVTAKGLQDTPIYNEMLEIFKHPLCLKHIILIDDARLFNGTNDYPTLEQMEQMAKTAGFTYFNVEADIICICVKH